MLYLILFLLWLLCGFIASGFMFAYFQREFTLIRKSRFEAHQQIGVVCLLFGVIALFASYFGYSSHGWLNPWGKNAKVEAGIISVS